MSCGMTDDSCQNRGVGEKRIVPTPNNWIKREMQKRESMKSWV